MFRFSIMTLVRLLVLLSFLSLSIFLWSHQREFLLRSWFFNLRIQKNSEEAERSADVFTPTDVLFDFLDDQSHGGTSRQSPSPEDCTMANCFIYTQCREDEFKVFVYPGSEPVSPIYENILSALRRSRYLTDRPDEACLFVLGLDTISRDRLMVDQYVKNLKEKFRLDPLIQQFWNEGRNHLIFNLYSGTFPDYGENDFAGFDIGFAILAKASMSVSAFRKNFDVSLPLFHNTLPVRGQDPGFSVKSSRFPERQKKYLLSFKGKRYLYGIGSESRNFLYHIHNKRDIIILTTCNHGKQPKELRDKRCDQDDQEYNLLDYHVLLDNTTFCLVPRGRRHGSFRFLEALQAGCIPVVLSNGWELPFSEIIDWNRAVLLADERLLTQIPTMVRSIGFDKILAMRQQSQLLWRQYFSSIERIVFSTLEIVRSRLSPIRRSKELWNTWPASSISLIPYLRDSDILPDFAKNVRSPRSYLEQNFTAIITVTQRQNIGTTFVRLLKTLNRLPFVDKVLVLSPWKEATIQAVKGWTWIRVPVNVAFPSDGSASDVISMLDAKVSTNCITLLRDDCDSSWEELEFGFHVWKSYPDRIVGFRSSSHFWESATESYKYSSKLTNDYSMVSLKDAFLHVQYYRLMWHYRGRVEPDLPAGCSDILLNFLAAAISRLPPLKVPGKTGEVCQETEMESCLQSHAQRNVCLNRLTKAFGFMPLVRSSVAYNPVLFKDNVSSYRKKYRHLE